ncbi:hypothetical protein SARC_02732 [Sphaeroforma arctica JP610]|uniref:Condensin complex subunit 2 n=1 Tax=Sphaeroforma arctica JP610 TaxID=667725 RepID=A0A0L0G7T6_9EUKA|nr:hypothetical protein SARC_02732 [Sphaeroforma arctica JP610]KNC85072.1 hypothetical protein SARC_02732 [Sphaeroforma arctica JP610]|eukprot:XP_014158974.1 hypothetical protein SARC_02732 [Sphaeroforma arctica JP610]
MVYNYDNQRDNDYCRDVGDGEGDYGKDDNGMMGLGMDDDDDVSGFDGFTEDVQDHIRVDRLPKFDLGFDDLDLVEPPKTVGRINIGYARTAKQVDVRMLKKKLWSQINTDKPPNDTPEAEGGDQNKENEADNNQTGQDISFKSVCQQVQSTLSTNQSRDVSVPISFVCLLHLANEKGLSIEQLDPELMGDLQIRRMAAALNT